jgi:hypothetical protein
MNRAQQRFKDWIIAHVRKPELMTETDSKILDIIIVQVPAFLEMMLMFIILSWLYLWALGKYGFEKTLIVLLINVVISINQVNKAIHELVS